MEPTTKQSARLSAQQWRQIIKQQHESGLSQKVFCQSRNIGLSTFTTWKHKLEKKADSFFDQLQPEASPDWIELPPDTQETTASASWHIERELAGRCGAAYAPLIMFFPESQVRVWHEKILRWPSLRW